MSKRIYSGFPQAKFTQVQADWNEADATQPDYIKNKPVIPAAQIQSDWNEANPALLDFIKNKPTIPTTFDPITQILLYEDWICGHSPTSLIDGIGWALSGNGTVVFPTDTGGVRGFVRVNSGAALNNVEVMTSGNATNNPMIGRFDNVAFDMKFRVALGQITNTDFIVGLTAGTSISASGRGAYVRFQTSLGDTKFTFAISGAVSTQKSVVNSIAADTNYHTFRIRGTGNGDIFFSVDGGTETLITCASAGGVTNTVRIFRAIQTNAAVNATFDEDYMYLMISGLTR